MKQIACHAFGMHTNQHRVAMDNCIAMFVIFALLSLLFVASVLSRLGAIGAGAPYGGMGCMGCAMLVGGIFAAIYLPLRWRVIMGLPGSFKVLGLIGGFGLIGFLLLGIVGLAFGSLLSAPG